MLELRIEAHPSLDLHAFSTAFPHALGVFASPDWLRALLSPAAEAPVARDEETRVAVRDLLRHGGYKPTGRGKPASEYLARAAGEGGLSSINVAVDAGNAVSLHSGLPVSVVDLSLAAPPLSVSCVPLDADPDEASYVFNAAGQAIDFRGLLCLLDASGPCANAVKDALRTKTTDGTTRTLSLVWGTTAAAELGERATAWYRELIERSGATTEDVGLVAA